MELSAIKITVSIFLLFKNTFDKSKPYYLPFTYSFFSNNKRQFKMDMEGIKDLKLEAKNISSQTLPLDFERNKHIHNCWIISHSE